MALHMKIFFKKHLGSVDYRSRFMTDTSVHSSMPSPDSKGKHSDSSLIDLRVDISGTLRNTQAQ